MNEKLKDTPFIYGIEECKLAIKNQQDIARSFQKLRDEFNRLYGLFEECISFLKCH